MSPSPAFGRSVLPLWHLDPDQIYLNHGTVGATPRPVLEAQWAIMADIERSPAQTILREMSNPNAIDWSGQPPRLRQMALAVADWVNAPVGLVDEDVAHGMVLVDNITTGANAVVGSVGLSSGDRVAVTNLGYGGVTRAVEAAADAAGASVYVIDLPTPGAPVSSFVSAFADGLEPGTVLAVVDHLSAFSGLLLPVYDFVSVCRRLEVPVMVDGAHVPGQMPLDVGAIGADWYVANLHKWGWVPRSAGFVWSAEQHRHADALHHPVASWGRGQGMSREFDFPGTRDPSPFLSIPAARALRAELGGDDEIADYCHQLVWSAAKLLADRWGVGFDTPEEMVAAMTTVRLPAQAGATPDDAESLRRHLFDECRIEVPVFSTRMEAYGAGPDSGDVGGVEPRLAVRVCAQVYNELGDFEALAEAVTRHSI